MEIDGWNFGREELYREWMGDGEERSVKRDGLYRDARVDRSEIEDHMIRYMRTGVLDDTTIYRAYH